MPVVGGKHAKKNPDDNMPLDIAKGTWLHNLNKCGTTRVGAARDPGERSNQETYMRKAWEQVQKNHRGRNRIKATVFLSMWH